MAGSRKCVACELGKYGKDGDCITCPQQCLARGSKIFGGEKIVTAELVYPRSAIAADIDGDGDLDIATASERDNKVAWFENINGKGLFGSPQVITSNANYAYTIIGTDIDGDGDIDLVSGSKTITRSHGIKMSMKSTFGPEQVVTTQASSVNCVIGVDIDGDGDVDLASASPNDNKIAWYENLDGRGTYGSQKLFRPMLPSR